MEDVSINEMILFLCARKLNISMMQFVLRLFQCLWWWNDAKSSERGIPCIGR